jgi:penicillin G amidase
MKEKNMASRYFRKTTRISFLLLFIALIFSSAAAGYVYYQLRQSLPVLEGELSAGFVSAATRVDRDKLGTVTITGSSRTDVASALGFCHAQERYFNMDLFRRKAAGELSGLFGAAALPEDRRVRVHRFRDRARKFVKYLPTEEQELISAYVSGVNAGLSALEEYPFEYLVLKQEPLPWKNEDTLLVVYAMYLDLQGGNPEMESAHGLMSDLLPAPMYEFLAPAGTDWDAPVDGAVFSTPGIPGPEVFSLRDKRGAQTVTDDLAVAGSIPDFLCPTVSGSESLVPPAACSAGTPRERKTEMKVSGHGRSAAPFNLFPSPSQSSGYSALHAGSNNWAVSGAFTGHGKSIVANDMHLNLMVPNIWFRASLVFPGAGGERRVTGVTLPGTPLVIAGSNGEIAWGFTNSQGDWLDLVILESGPEEGTYLTPEGYLPITRVEEKIICSDGTEEILEIEETVWGPVIDVDYLGRKRVARWVAYDPAGINLALAGMEEVSTVAEALDIAALCGMPAQNFTVADMEGNIGWTILGPIPRRIGYDGKFPISWASGENRWDEYLDPEEYPRIVNPSGGRIWTANAKVVGGEKLAKIGFGGYALGPRAKQIRDDLFALDKASEKDLLEVQLDNRAKFLERWRDFLLEDVLKPETVEGCPRFQEVRQLLVEWGGRASPDSAGYRIVRQFRNHLAQRIFNSLTAGCMEADERFSYTMIGREESPLWKLVNEKPRHLLPVEFQSWNDLMINSLEQLIEEAEKDPVCQSGSGLAEWTWGARNTAAIRHALSPFIPIPFISRFLDAPPDQLPGDSRMPRAQGPGFGASERMVVSPGLEEQGIFHMPGGQSGHPLSPFYLSGHADWVQGIPTPFLPGEAVYRLMLKP